MHLVGKRDESKHLSSPRRDSLWMLQENRERDDALLHQRGLEEASDRSHTIHLDIPNKRKGSAKRRGRDASRRGERTLFEILVRDGTEISDVGC